jgi:pimeloyl-ACP methyl ester carboxylesterase
MRKTSIHLAAVACLAIFASAQAIAKDLTGWGVVLLHGKGGSGGQMATIASALQAAGAKTVVPTASWSKGYQTYDATMDEVSRYVATVRGQGAQRIAIIGQSLGTNVALGYGAKRGGVDAIVAISPGHFPERFGNTTSESVNRAKAMVASGRGNEVASFTDTNQGRVYQVQVTAAAYVSFFDPNGPAVMSRNAANLRVNHLLWIVGTGDAGAQSAAQGGKVVTLSGGHFDMPKASAQEVVTWLESL